MVSQIIVINALEAAEFQSATHTSCFWNMYVWREVNKGICGTRFVQAPNFEEYLMHVFWMRQCLMGGLWWKLEVHGATRRLHRFLLAKHSTRNVTCQPFVFNEETTDAYIETYEHLCYMSIETRQLYCNYTPTAIQFTVKQLQQPHILLDHFWNKPAVVFQSIKSTVIDWHTVVTS